MSATIRLRCHYMYCFLQREFQQLILPEPSLMFVADKTWRILIKELLLFALCSKRRLAVATQMGWKQDSLQLQHSTECPVQNSP